jgi:hypothetical protein
MGSGFCFQSGFTCVALFHQTVAAAGLEDQSPLHPGSPVLLNSPEVGGTESFAVLQGGVGGHGFFYLFHQMVDMVVA